jgi:hypothetical protein
MIHPSNTTLLTSAPFGISRYQSCVLQRRLHPRIAELDLMVSMEFLNEMLHVQIEVLLSI